MILCLDTLHLKHGRGLFLTNDSRLTPCAAIPVEFLP
jgi:hypothetical protein